MTMHGIGSGPSAAERAYGFARVGPQEDAAALARGDRAKGLPDHAGSVPAPEARVSGGGTAAPAPEGTDPALWSVLTAEERHFFARALEGGPLVYGRESAGTALSGVRVGGRIDVRV